MSEHIAPHRAIIHIDLDSFYAQVEMRANPSLRDVPMGVQQKYLVVTANRAARARGVGKMVSVAAARAACPEIILTNGCVVCAWRLRACVCLCACV